MAGTPYWRERKLVTSSSLTNPSCTRVEPRRALWPASFSAFSALSSCSGVMIFSLTRRSPSLCDIFPLSLDEELTQMCFPGLWGNSQDRNGKRELGDSVFGDRNCQLPGPDRRCMHLRGTNFGSWRHLKERRLLSTHHSLSPVTRPENGLAEGLFESGSGQSAERRRRRRGQRRLGNARAAGDLRVAGAERQSELVGDLRPEFAHYVPNHVRADAEAHTAGGRAEPTLIAGMIEVADGLGTDG